MKKRHVFGCFAAMCALLLIATGAWAERVRGVTDTEVKIACLVDLSGPGKYGGPPVADAFRTYVNWVNATGGIHGRKLNLIVEDNGILPNTTMLAARKVLLRDEVFAIPFNLGSAGASAIIPLIEQHQAVLMPHGANKEFFIPGNKWVFVPHTVQYSQASRAVEFILEQNPEARIGIIYQDDAFGREGLAGARAAAEFMGTELVNLAPYRTGTIDFSSHMASMRDSRVDWIVLWTYLPQSAAIIRQKTAMNWDVNLISNNTTGVPPLFALTGEASDGYMLVTPYAPGWMDIPGINRIKEITKEYGDYERTLGDPTYPDYLYLAGWGYIEAFAQGLRMAGRNLTPESLVEGLRNVRDFDMGGAGPNISFSPDSHVSSFSSLILRANGEKKRFEIIDPIREPKTPIN